MALLLLALLPLASQAQFPERIQSGVRVRVWLPEPFPQDDSPRKQQLVRGSVVAVGRDTLHLSIPGTASTIAVERGSIRRLDVSKGPPSRSASAVERAIGFAIAGAIWSAFENDPRSTEWPHYNRTWRAAEEGAKVGAAIGAVVGFLLPTERWRRVGL